MGFIGPHIVAYTTSTCILYGLQVKSNSFTNLLYENMQCPAGGLKQ